VQLAFAEPISHKNTLLTEIDLLRIGTSALWSLKKEMGYGIVCLKVPEACKTSDSFGFALSSGSGSRLRTTQIIPHPSFNLHSFEFW